jgi:hypothetical protein
VKSSLNRLVEKVAELDDPILEIQSHHDGCQISFLLRGRDIKSHYEAMESLARAGTQAEHLVAGIRRQGNPALVLVYEYDRESKKWYPSYAELADGTLVTDNQKLIVEQELPRGMSLGLTSIRTRP